ncbi:hypothetical protein BML2496_39670 [Providencia rettgeri]|nr:hypothetical protein BML2496_39670 [Providencia rettgeri]
MKASIFSRQLSMVTEQIVFITKSQYIDDFIINIFWIRQNKLNTPNFELSSLASFLK